MKLFSNTNNNVFQLIENAEQNCNCSIFLEKTPKLIYADGKLETVFPINKSSFERSEITNLLHGDFEINYLGENSPPMILCCTTNSDKENKLATLIYNEFVSNDKVIRGDALMCYAKHIINVNMKDKIDENAHATVIYADGKITNITPKNNTETFSLKEIQDIVGGYIESSMLDSNYIALFNEEGIMRQLPNNKKAEEYIKSKFKNSVLAKYSSPFLYGNVVICHRFFF